MSEEQFGGKTLRDLREQAGLNQAYVAVTLGYRPATLGDWERGKTEPRLSLDEWDALAQLYGCTLEKLKSAIQETKKAATGSP